MIFGKTNNYFSVRAIHEILKTFDLADENERTHYVIMNLLYETGAHVNEIFHINVRDIDFTDRQITLKTGNTTRRIPLSTHLTENIRQHTKENYSTGSERLFFHETNMSCMDLCRILRIYIKRARIHHPGLIPDLDSVKGFRISRANHLYQTGLGIEDLRYFLGHNTIIKTKRYIGILFHTS